MPNLISIIVPIFNSERYLDKCILSILAQTYTYWELLLIDDGSTDSSGAICDTYAAQDDRIRVFHKPNGGVSSARNLGLDNAKGEWVTFVDSDDWIMPMYLTHMYEHIANVDLIVSSVTSYNNNGHMIRLYNSYIPAFLNSTDTHLLFEKYDLHSRTSPWSKLYKLSVINNVNLRFDEAMHHGEDLIFLYRYLLECNNFYITGDCDYCYLYDREGSLTKRVLGFNIEQYQYYQINKSIDRLIRQKKITQSIALDNLNWIKAHASRRLLNSVYHSSMGYKKRIDVLKQCCQTGLLSLPTHSYKEKIQFILLTYRMFFIYDILRRLC